MRHLDDEVIARALRGTLPVPEVTAAVEHAADCPDCLARLEGRPAEVERRAALAGDSNGAGSVGRYLILSRLGAGGMGVVYSAYDPELDRRVAVKVLHLQPGGGQASGQAILGRARLLREAQAMARLAHPNVIPVHDVGTVGDSVFFAMEEVEGGTLRDYLRQQRSWREVVAVFTQAGRGLAAAHRAGIVHRDFKPENVLIGDDDGRVRVTDFGVAHRMATVLPPETSAGKPSSAAGLPVTRISQVSGTPGYMAPEQLEGVVSAAADQFSFCVALYEGLTGSLPFERPSLKEDAPRFPVKDVEFPPGHDIPGYVREVVLRGLRIDPNARFPSMDALLEALARDPRQRRIRTAAGAVLGLAVVALGARALVINAREARACGELSARAEASWSRSRDGIAAAFRATREAYAEDALQVVSRGMGDFSQRWGKARREVCLGSAALPERHQAAAGACLDQAVRIMDGASAILARADATVVQHAAAMMDALPSVQPCLAVDALESAPPPPLDLSVAAKVAGARAALARASILAIPRPAEGIAAARPILAELERLGHRPALAEAYFVLGEAELQADLTSAAEGSLQRAAELALEGRDDRLFIRAASRLAYVLGGYDVQHARADDWLKLALRAYDRIGRPEALAGWLALQQVGVLIGLAKWPECAAAARRAVEYFRRDGETFQETEAFYLISFCESYSRGIEEVLPASEQALARYLETYGPHHPQTANAMSSVAEYRWYAGDLAGALDLTEKSERETRAIGHPTLQLSGILSWRAQLLLEVGRSAEARALAEEALSVLAQVPHRPVLRAKLRAVLAQTELAQGRVQDAGRGAGEAAATCDKEGNPRAPDTCAFVRFIHAQALLAQGQRAAAAQQAAKAREGYAALPVTRVLREKVESWAIAAGLSLPAAP